MEIINFINDKGKLVSEPILDQFVEKYPNQNQGLLGTDVYEFAKRFNDDCTLIEDKNYLITAKSSLFYVLCGSHMFYVYNNGDVIEKWDPMTWQHTTNNCTLYAALVAIIRPLTTFEKTKELLRKISDAEGSSTCKKLAEISQHFFNRGLSNFIYPSVVANIIAPKKTEKADK